MATGSAEPVEMPPAAALYVESLAEAADGQILGVYLAGSPGLGDLSPRQSNLDLVVVTERSLRPESMRRLVTAHRSLRLNGRDARVCYTTWESLAAPPSSAVVTVFTGGAEGARGDMANPMTWAILAGAPVALTGPARPAVHSDPGEVQAWFADRLPAVVARTGSLLWRRHLTRAVLQATRCAHGALTGEVLSLRRAGELSRAGASHTGHRVITDALGYREGASTSMYWGPFERKANAETLMQDLLGRVRSAPAAS